MSIVSSSLDLSLVLSSFLVLPLVLSSCLALPLVLSSLPSCLPYVGGLTPHPYVKIFVVLIRFQEILI